MNTGAKFDRFLTNIELTASQQKDAQNKHYGVRKALHDNYYPSTAYDGSTSTVVGSYGKHTAVRSPTDIDVLFIIPGNLFQRYNNSTGNGQSQLLQDIKDVLKKRYPLTQMRGDGQVVVVAFANSFGVEVVPVFRSPWTSSDVYLTPNTNDGGSWGKTNPGAEKKQISDSNTDSKGNTVHLIKMLKVWKGSCNVPIASFRLELLAVQFISQWQYKGNSSTYYDWMTRDFFEYMLINKNGWVFVPGTGEALGLGEAWASRAETAKDRAVKACNYEAKDDQASDDLADAEWKKIFGEFFQG